MRIITFASGSTGNCSLISDGRVNILIDAGISMRRIVSCLHTLGLTPQDVSGVLITHEHSDHISGLSMLCKYYKLRIFAPEELCDILEEYKPELHSFLNPLPLNEYIELDGLNIKCFRTPHDSRFSVGYRVEGSSVIAYATDTGSVTDSMKEGLTGADIAVIEANHDVQMLKNGPYPYYLKRRILSPNGHLSNNDSAILAEHLAKNGTRYIIVAHLSRENNTPQLAYSTVADLTFKENTKVFVAPMDEMLAVETGEDSVCSI